MRADGIVSRLVMCLLNSLHLEKGKMGKTRHKNGTTCSEENRMPLEVIWQRSQRRSCSRPSEVGSDEFINDMAKMQIKSERTDTNTSSSDATEQNDYT